MNSPKEKAQELLDRCKMMYEDERGSLWNEISIHSLSKQGALIAAEEIKLAFVGISNWEAAAYWRNVEQELEKP
jgi:hypothetical protein